VPHVLVAGATWHPTPVHELAQRRALEPAGKMGKMPPVCSPSRFCIGISSGGNMVLSLWYGRESERNEI